MGMMPHPERASESIIAAQGSKNEAITIFRSLVSNLKPKAIA
jgi:phosphoribosylformylglycinamidine (FGAM) synthase-like amidotransferase family enzyme